MSLWIRSSRLFAKIFISFSLVVMCTQALRQLGSSSFLIQIPFFPSCLITSPWELLLGSEKLTRPAGGELFINGSTPLSLLSFPHSELLFLQISEKTLKLKNLNYYFVKHFWKELQKHFFKNSKIQIWFASMANIFVSFCKIFLQKSCYVMWCYAISW